MKTALVTGASDGIGLEIARALAGDGFAVTMVARNQGKLEIAKASLVGSGHSCVVADLSKKIEVDGLKTLIDENKYDVFINNAGVGMYGRFTDLQLSDQVRMMNLNMTSVTALAMFYLGQAKSGDALVNVASTLGTTSFPGAAVYAGSKAFVTIFSESLWWEFKTRGVFVTAFCPGATATNFHQVSGRSQDVFPEFVLQKPQAVARELMRALSKRKRPKAVSGIVNRMMLLFHRVMPRKIVVNMMGSFAPI